MKAEHKIPLPMWDKFVKDVLDGANVDASFLYVRGAKPDKVFRLATAKGARKAVEFLTRLKVTNWVAFSVGDVNRPVAMLATAALLHDLAVWREKKKAEGRMRLYVEPGAGGQDGAFPGMAEPDKAEIKAFYEEVKRG